MQLLTKRKPKLDVDDSKPTGLGAMLVTLVTVFSLIPIWGGLLIQLASDIHCRWGIPWYASDLS